MRNKLINCKGFLENILKYNMSFDSSKVNC